MDGRVLVLINTEIGAMSNIWAFYQAVLFVKFDRLQIGS